MSDLHPSLGVMVDDIQTSIRQTSFTEDGSYKPKALWWEFTAFQHTGVPSCQSIGDSLDTENEGSVPGNSYTVSPSSEFWMVPLINRLTMALFPVPHHMAPWGPVHACPVSCRLEPGHLGPSWFAWQDLAASQKLHGATRVDQQEGLRGSCLLSHTLMTFSCMLLKNCSSMQEDGLMEGRLGSWPSGKGLRGCSNSIVSCPDISLSKIAPSEYQLLEQRLCNSTSLSLFNITRCMLFGVSMNSQRPCCKFWFLGHMTKLIRRIWRETKYATFLHYWQNYCWTSLPIYLFSQRHVLLWPANDYWQYVTWLFSQTLQTSIKNSCHYCTITRTVIISTLLDGNLSPCLKTTDGRPAWNVWNDIGLLLSALESWNANLKIEPVILATLQELLICVHA